LNQEFKEYENINIYYDTTFCVQGASTVSERGFSASDYSETIEL